MVHEVGRRIVKHCGLRCIADWTQADGESLLLRDDTTGQAYEIQIRPAAAAKHPCIRQQLGAGRGWSPMRNAQRRAFFRVPSKPWHSMPLAQPREE
jgi:hypothetical protein